MLIVIRIIMNGQNKNNIIINDIFITNRKETFEHMKTWLCDVRYNSNTNTAIMLVGNKRKKFNLYL